MSALSRVVNIPRMRLPLPVLQLPSAMVVLGAVFVTYFLVLSGVVYDVITESPSMGMVRDEHGAQRPQAFLPYQINRQYIIEGLTAGFFFALGGGGFILIDQSVAKQNRELPKRNRYLMAFGGAALIGLSYLLCIVFIRIKVPNY